MKNPRVVISACLLGQNCRWDGEVLAGVDLGDLLSGVEIIEVCPEVGLGLSVPRLPIDVFQDGSSRKLIESQSGRDLSLEMLDHCRSWLKAAGPIDGFILKARSPSCAIADAKVLDFGSRDQQVGVGPGFFAQVAQELYPDLIFISEEDLRDPKLRKQFLESVTKNSK